MPAFAAVSSVLPPCPTTSRYFKSSLLRVCFADLVLQVRTRTVMLSLELREHLQYKSPRVTSSDLNIVS